MLCLRDLEANIDLSQPVDLTVENRTLDRNAVTVGNIWKLVLEIVTHRTDRDSLDETNTFLKMVIESVESEQKGQKQKILLSLNLLESIKEYYSLAALDSSRGACATKSRCCFL